MLHNELKSAPYKLICLDLDGTLLNSKSQICAETKNALLEAEKKGVKIAIVTGRATFEAEHHASEISANAYYIGANGAYVGDQKHVKAIFETGFASEQRTALNQIIKKYHLQPVYSMKDEMRITGVFPYLIFLRHTLKDRGSKRSAHIKYLSPLRKIKFTITMKEALHKCVFFFANIDKMKQVERHLREHVSFETVVTSSRVIEVTPKGINKAYGVNQLIQYLGIEAKDVIAFGDSENDLEMLKFAGCGVAMGNATELVKSHANYVTKTNDEAGIAYALTQLLSYD
ncbi:Cof-type HAD-IIB family hydrolase [Fusibacter bizertensis]